MSEELAILGLTAATVGVVHTLLGPDHYVPFLVLARARDWSAARTLGVTFLCGVGHVAGSVLLGAVGIALGWAATTLVWLESMRGDIASWVLLGFGIAYTAWGSRQAIRNRPHMHWHSHGDGTVHSHQHTHHTEHAHPHAATAIRGPSPTAWALFVIFVLGPCEALIPILMIPAAAASWGGVVFVATIFATATLATMLAVTWLGYVGLSVVGLGPLERFGHMLAGVALIACGLAIRFGL